MSALIVILALSFLVIIHELGHFLLARWSKIRVEEFGLGYPPRLLNLSRRSRFFRWGETIVSLNWIPFGGFVRMAGEQERLLDKRQPQAGDYMAATAWRRLAVVLAGPLTNLFFGFLLFSLVFGLTGIPREITTPRIASIAPASPAAEAQLPTDVEILGFMIEGELVTTPDVATLQALVAAHRGQSLEVVTTGTCQGLACQESAHYFPVRLRTLEETPAGEGSLGVTFTSFVTVFYPWYQMPWESVRVGFQQTLELSRMILDALGSLVVNLGRGQFSDQLAGPIGIVHQAEESGYFRAGWLAILSFTAMLSINLAVINLLPIPPLDGGRILTTLLEPLVARRYLIKIEYYLTYLGYLLLVLLIVAVTARDIVRLIF